MKILRETMSYIGKNLIFVFGFAVLPACFIGGLLNPFMITNFIVDYKSLTINNFGDILKPLFGIGWMELINCVLAIILVVLICSAFLGNIENHFKSGKLALSNTLNFINNTVLIVLAYTAIFIVGYLAIKFVLALIIFILHIVFGLLGSAPSLALYITSVAVTVLTLVFSGYFLAYGLIALIDTIMCGYSIGTSFSDANDLLSKKVYKVMFLIALPFLIVLPLVVLGNLFGFMVVANIVSIMILLMYYPVLAFTMYYEFSNLTRYDNIKKYYY